MSNDFKKFVKIEIEELDKRKKFQAIEWIPIDSILSFGNCTCVGGFLEYSEPSPQPNKIFDIKRRYITQECYERLTKLLGVEQ